MRGRRFNSINLTLGLKGRKSIPFRFGAKDLDLQLPYLTRISKKPKSLPRFLNSPSGFNYLSAERLGPRDFQGIRSEPTEALRVGVQGQYTAEVMGRRESEKIREGLRHPKHEKFAPLNKQVEFWMQEMFPGVKFLAQQGNNTNTASLSIEDRGDWSRPQNVGFGISYALPIVVAGLLSPKDSLFIVENPEAHLHPAAQSKMAFFLARLAANGVQVMVETHSDHIINGIRLATVEKGHPLKKEDVILHNFDRNEDGSQRNTEIEITSTGSLTDWPVGFFDQIERDLAAILEARSK